ncbi:MAG: hypothetical protein MUP04_02600 [Anaerolineae bacterium]|nr:hypothetical protein [Anaerolineae bacterium]
MAKEGEKPEERLRDFAALCAISEAIGGRSSSAILIWERRLSHDHDVH